MLPQDYTVRDSRNKAMQHAFVMAGVRKLAEEPAAARRKLLKTIFGRVGHRIVLRKDGTIEFARLVSAE